MFIFSSENKGNINSVGLPRTTKKYKNNSPVQSECFTYAISFIGTALKCVIIFCNFFNTVA